MTAAARLPATSPPGPEKVKSEAKPKAPDRAIRQAGSASPLLFARPDWSLYLSLASLPQKAGVSTEVLPRLVCKELVDNGLDAADAAGRPGAVDVEIDRRGNLIVTDEGIGIPDATLEKLATIFSVAREMLSSKLLRKASRGAVGNGLRVCLGFLTATRGRLVIETAGIRVELGDEPFLEEHLDWAESAIELAKRSGKPAFTGKSSVHWHDSDHFATLLRSAVGNPSLRRFLGEFDGLSGSRVQTAVAAKFLRRPAASLNAAEAAALLDAAQANTRRRSPRRCVRWAGMR